MIATNSNSANTRATYIECKVGGAKVVALIDSGACTSMMNEKLAMKLRLRIKKLEEPREWKAANGGRIQVAGKAKLNLKFDETHIKCETVVAPNLSHELIIGTDVMEREEFIIDYKNNVVNIGEIMIQKKSLRSTTYTPLRRLKSNHSVKKSSGGKCPKREQRKSS